MDGADGGQVLLVRAWWQQGRLVARVTWSVPGQSEPVATVVLGRGELDEVLRRWLDALGGHPDSR